MLENIHDLNKDNKEIKIDSRDKDSKDYKIFIRKILKISGIVTLLLGSFLVAAYISYNNYTTILSYITEKLF